MLLKSSIEHFWQIEGPNRGTGYPLQVILYNQKSLLALNRMCIPREAPPIFLPMNSQQQTRFDLLMSPKVKSVVANERPNMTSY